MSWVVEKRVGKSLGQRVKILFICSGASDALSLSLMARLPKDDSGGGAGVGVEAKYWLSCSRTHLRSAKASQKSVGGRTGSMLFTHHDIAMTNMNMPFFPRRPSSPTQNIGAPPPEGMATRNSPTFQPVDNQSTTQPRQLQMQWYPRCGRRGPPGS